MSLDEQKKQDEIPNETITQRMPSQRQRQPLERPQLPESEDVLQTVSEAAPETPFTTESETAFATEPETAFSTESVTTFTTEPETTFSTEPETTFATEPVTTFATEPETTFTTEPVTTFATEPETTFTTESETTFSTESETTFATEPETTFTTEPETTFSTEPETTFSTEPETTFSTEPETTFSTEPETTFSTEPETTFSTEPVLTETEAATGFGGDTFSTEPAAEEPKTDSLMGGTSSVLGSTSKAESLLGEASALLGKTPGTGSSIGGTSTTSSYTSGTSATSSLSGDSSATSSYASGTSTEKPAFQTKYPPLPKKQKKAGSPRNALIVAFGLFMVIVIIIFLLATSPSKKSSSKSPKFMEQIKTQEVKINDVAEIDSFFLNYYKALSSGNTTDLEAMYDDPSKAHITTEVASIVSDYDDLEIYVTPGIEEQDTVAFVSNDIHFANIKSTAPSVDSFYLKYNEDENTYKICTGMYTDQDILRFMNLVSYREPIRSLLEDTNKDLNKVLSDNKDLNNLYLLMQTMANENWDQQTGEEAEASVQENSEAKTEKQLAK